MVTEQSLQERSEALDKREQALVETEKMLKIQSDEVKDAAKVLNTKAVDLAHEKEMLDARGKELDERERKIVDAEQK